MNIAHVKNSIAHSFVVLHNLFEMRHREYRDGNAKHLLQELQELQGRFKHAVEMEHTGLYATELVSIDKRLRHMHPADGYIKL